VFVLKPGLFEHAYVGGAIVAQSLHFTLQPKQFPFHSQKSFEQRIEMTFHRRLGNINGLIVGSLYCPYIQNLI